MQSAWNSANYRHWSPESETYAPGEVLLRYLRDSWTPDNIVNVETFPCSGCRQVEVYFFLLVRGDKRISMPLIANPVVLRLIHEYELTVQRDGEESNILLTNRSLFSPFGTPSTLLDESVSRTVDNRA
jgi:hypothetical protein